MWNRFDEIKLATNLISYSLGRLVEVPLKSDTHYISVSYIPEFSVSPSTHLRWSPNLDRIFIRVHEFKFHHQKHIRTHLLRSVFCILLGSGGFLASHRHNHRTDEHHSPVQGLKAGKSSPRAQQERCPWGFPGLFPSRLLQGAEPRGETYCDSHTLGILQRHQPVLAPGWVLGLLPWVGNDLHWCYSSNLQMHGEKLPAAAQTYPPPNFRENRFIWIIKSLETESWLWKYMYLSVCVCVFVSGVEGYSLSHTGRSGCSL